MVVDPPFAIEPILEEAERRDVRIVRTIETHTHADHVSGHGRLALEHGIPVSVHADAGVDYPHDPMHDGDEIEVGPSASASSTRPATGPSTAASPSSTTRAATSRGSCSPATRSSSAMPPGPTSRSARSRAPKGSSTRCSRLLELADGVEVFPGHVAGSLCGKAMSSKPSTTIGFERRFNPTLQLDRDRRVRRGRRPRSALPSRRTSPASWSEPRPVRRARRRSPRSSPHRPQDAQLLDVRTRRRITSPVTGPEPINVPVAGTSFSTKAGFVLDAGRAGVRARRDRRRGAARDPRAPLGRVLRHRRVRARRRGRADRRRHGRRARGADRRRRRGDRRAREGRPRHGLHPREPQRPLPAAGAAAAPTSRPTGRW